MAAIHAAAPARDLHPLDSMFTDRSEHPARPHTIRWFVHRYLDEILDEWISVVRELPLARHLDRVRLVDHIPVLLDEIADIADEDASGLDVTYARRHALDRLAEGFDITMVVKELSLLRGAVLTVWERHVAGDDLHALRALDLALDRAIETSVARYTEAHERTLRAIDRISTASFVARSVDDFLQRLLGVFMEATSAADVGAIFVREGERLHLRAAVGLDEELDHNASLAVGEGFAGTIARTCRPLALGSASTDELVEQSLLRGKGVRAFYGIPMIHERRAVGVAFMGSRRYGEFSAEDRHFLRSLGLRATMGLVQHTLRRELLASEQRLRELAGVRARELADLEALLAASPAGVAFLDRDLRYVRVNEAMARINQWPVEEHIGRTLSEILPVHAPRLSPLLRGVLDTGQPVINYVARAGDLVYMLNYFPVLAASGEVVGVGGIVLDVTEAANAEEELRIEQARMESILEHSPAAIWVKDAEGRIIVANNRIAAALGHTRDELIGHRSSEFLPPEIGFQHEKHDRIVLAEQRAIEVEETVPSPDGPRTFLTVKFPIPGPPPLVGGIATEITERKVMEEQLRAAVRSREEMMAVVSHDLRNPLGTIQLAAGTLLADLGDAPHMRKLLDMIMRAGWRMDHLIKDLLDSASIRAGRLELRLQPESAEHLAREVCDQQQPLAHEKHLRIEAHLALEGVTILADRDRLLQVFANLIGNAIKFCRAGDRITVTGERVANEVQFSVRDTGPGIPPDILPRLFDPYVSGADHRTLGAGLGLYISRGIIEGHGGRIWVESTLGHGATFWFTVPAG